MVAGTKYRGQFESEVRRVKNVIILSMKSTRLLGLELQREYGWSNILSLPQS